MGYNTVVLRCWGAVGVLLGCCWGALINSYTLYDTFLKSIFSAGILSIDVSVCSGCFMYFGTSKIFTELISNFAYFNSMFLH